MKIQLSLTLKIEREKPEEPHETFESQGSLVESVGQPRYLGFTPEQQE